jgi:hypothetical protein
MLSVLALRPASWGLTLAAFLVLLGLCWSTAQWRDLSWQFEVQFPLLHLFALASLWSFALAISREDWRWLPVAILSDFLAVYSTGSGIFLTPGFVLIALCTLRLNWVVAAFFVAHAVILATFLAGYHSPNEYALAGMESLPRAPHLLRRLAGVSNIPPTRHPGWIFDACAVSVAAAYGRTSGREAPASRGTKPRRACCLRPVRVYRRHSPRPHPQQHSASACHDADNVLGRSHCRAMARAACPHGRPGSGLAPALAMPMIVFSNQDRFAADWSAHAQLLDETTAMARNGDFDNERLRELHHAGWLPDAMNKLRAFRLGPFAEP